MPRHTWTVRVELCETYDAVYAHAYLDHVPIHVSGRGQAQVSRRSRSSSAAPSPPAGRWQT